jgi:hypothetical protein
MDSKALPRGRDRFKLSASHCWRPPQMTIRLWSGQTPTTRYVSVRCMIRFAFCEMCGGTLPSACPDRKARVKWNRRRAKNTERRAQEYSRLAEAKAVFARNWPEKQRAAGRCSLPRMTVPAQTRCRQSPQTLQRVSIQFCHL